MVLSAAYQNWPAGLARLGRGTGKKERDMKMYTATIPKEVLEPRTRHAYYTRQQALFILVLTVVSIVPLVGISFFSFNYYRNSSIDRTATELAGLADSRRETIGLFLADQSNMMASLIDLYSPEQLGNQANLENIFQAINRNGVITDLDAIDANGAHRAYVGPFANQLADKNYAAADWFLAVRQEGSYTSDIFSGFRGVPHFVVAVTDPSRSLILRSTVNSDLFNSLLASAEVGPGGDAFILNKKGEAQTPSRLGSLQTPVALADVPADGSTAVFRAEEFIYATTNLKGGDWVLVLKENIDSSLTDFYGARNKAIAIIVLAIVLIVSVATFFGSSFINRIRVADQQRTALNDRMRAAEKMALIGRLAASVSHEINNPLQIIENQAGWISELIEDEQAGRPSDLKEYRDAADKIRTHVRRAKTITHKLLGFSRAGESVSTSTSINHLINETVSFLENEARNQQIELRVNLQRNLPRIMTDPSQLQQVFLNIVNNAIDAIRRDGVITIDTHLTPDNHIVAEFSDTGPGLYEEVQGRIFEPFFTTKDSKGTGLGLSISYDIVQRLGGDIEAKNREQGGSIFTVTLPVVMEDTEQKPQESR